MPALANEAQIRQVLEPKLGGAKIEGIQPAPISGLWEVRFRSERGGMQVIYTDATASYVIDGNIHRRCAPTAISPESACAS